MVLSEFLTADSMCKTPGAIYHFNITPESMSISISQLVLEMTEQEAIRLEDELHRMIEGIIAPFFKLKELA